MKESPLESLPVRGAWIEIKKSKTTALNIMSLPVRGAWIEIRGEVEPSERVGVAPRKGSVD